MPAGAELEMGNWELQVDATMHEQHFRSAGCSTILAVLWHCTLTRWQQMVTDTASYFATLCNTHVLYVDCNDTHKSIKTITDLCTNGSRLLTKTAIDCLNYTFSLHSNVLCLCRLGQCFMQPAQTTSLPSSTVTAGLDSTSFKKPLLRLSSVTSPQASPAGKTIKQQSAKPSWQHSPDAPGAIVVNNAQWQQAEQKGAMVPVVVDPYIAKSLRPHQAQGVQFLYECIMGLREANRQAPSASFAFSLAKHKTCCYTHR